MAKSNLVIVESPAKAKTIGKYLGPGYEVKASMGHVRDLPKSKLGVDVEHGFHVDYQPIKGKEEVISDLKKAAKKSEKVFLATDPDREGEAISWHLKEMLGIPDDKTYRVTFNEITKKVVNDSIANPRAIDMDLVNAQQARRVLDRIVGYQISPLLWKKIRRGLSAGRVQSVATRLVCEREEEIKAFVPQEYWSIEADLARIAPNLGQFKAAFHGREKKMELHSKDEVDAVMAAVGQAPFAVTGVKRQDKLRNPAPPFITSTLQQEASRKLNMTPRRTMSIAQQLYEGVDIAGEGTVGLITYMRTDSLRLSDEATAAARDFILSRYGANYYPGKPRVYKTKSGAQDAHEAIRPSNVNLTPEDVKKDLTAEQYKLYKLIWSRFLACQMASAIYDSVSIEVTSAGYTFRATHSSLKFSGYTAVYVEGKDEEEETFQSPLPDLKEGETVELTHQGPGGEGHRPPLHLRPHHLHHPGPGVCGEGGPGSPAHPPGRGGHRPDEGQIYRHRGHRLHRQHGGAAGRGGDRQGGLEEPADPVLRWLREGTEAGRGRPGRGAHQGARRGIRRDLPQVRPQPGVQVRPVRPVPGLPRLAGVRPHPAHCGGDAGQMPQVRRQDPEKDLQAGVCLLRLREQHQQGRGPQVRLHDLGRAGKGELSLLRPHPV